MSAALSPGSWLAGWVAGLAAGVALGLMLGLSLAVLILLVGRQRRIQGQRGKP